MDFRQAVDAYAANPTKEELNKQTAALCAEMTQKEKVYMLSGHPIAQIQKDMIKTGRNYNVHALPAGGCKRLGVPPVLFTDGPRGVVMGNSTCFPVSMLRASAFDPELEIRFGKAVADEAIAQGANYYAGVCINLVRNPRWGRSQETYGEDPFLLGEYGAALTQSVQEEGMIACPKHFALNSIEDLRFYVDVKCDDRTLHEVYLPHFKKCVDAGALSIMGAYNRYDEYYCCANKKLLTDILRKEWGFDGFVMSDFVWGCRDTEGCLRAGLDVEMMFTMQYSSGKIKKLLKKSNINEEHIDRAVRNILGALIRQIPKIKPRSMSTVCSQEHRALALEIAEKGMVLLENNGVLPLDKNAKVMVTGPYADEANVGDHGSSRVWDKNIVTPFAGLSKVFPSCSKESGEVAVVCVGSNRKKEGEYFANTGYALTEKPKDGGGDRASLRLETEEVDLIRSLKAQGKKVVVVLYSGCAIIVEEWKEYADAIIMNYYSGCEGGTALANLLCGDRNFTGKLPFTVAKREEDYPPIIGIGEKPYVIEYGYYHGYTKLDKENVEPAYPFGYGLSYTGFDIVLLYIGLDEISESEGLDRAHMRIPQSQVNLIEAVSAVNPNVVAVMSAGSAVEMPWLPKCKALIHGYLCGQAGATSVLKAIMGEVNPSGKLAESYPVKYEDVPSAPYFPAKERTAEYREGLYVGYRYFETANVPVLFPFGFGLSYTTFEYSDLTVSDKEATFILKNTGKMDGAEVAQLYVSKRDGDVFRPTKELKGFQKVFLKAGESKKVTIQLDDKAFRYFNVDTNKFEIEGGSYDILIGASVADIKLSGSVNVQGTGAKSPYEKAKFARYFSGDVKNISDAEFEALLGRPIPDGHWSGTLDMNDAICQLYYAKSGLARFVYKRMANMLNKSIEKGEPDLNITFIYNMPFRGIAKMAGGMCTMEMAEGILTICNGHFFKGLGRVIGGFFRSGRKRKAAAAIK